MKKFNLETGKIGEEIAKEYLKKKGFKILEQNYKTKYGEIDLVCQDKKTLVIVEVRTKKGENFGTPEQSLDKKKLRKLWFNAQSYTARKKIKTPCRIDAVCIVLSPTKHKVPERIGYYENII